MFRLSEIIANAFDLAGGNGKGVELEIGVVTLHALGALADMELEASGSARGGQARKFTEQFYPTTRTGTINQLPKFIRFRSGAFSRWELIDIVSDIEDLTEAERHNRRAILFYGDANDYRYELSFDPHSSFEVEMWGAATGADFASLDEAASVPEAFAHLAATRTALAALDDLLLTDAGQKLIPFIQNRKVTLSSRMRDLTHRWTVYRTNADNSLSDAQVRNYDPFDDGEYGSVFEVF